jgi:SAM-dependent methyltransferase
MTHPQIGEMNQRREVPAVLCPSCSAYVELTSARGQCSCGFKFRWQGNILDLATQPDKFYEGRYANEIHFDKTRLEQVGGRILLHFLVNGYYEAIVGFVPAGGRILDIGCAGGAKLLADWGEVTGLDLSLSTLEIAAQKYAWDIRANACCVEFAPQTFDAVVSCFFWEHVTFPDKDLLLEKFHRWLRPGGKAILLFDVASENPLFRWARKDRDLFAEAFIENDGHYGLESANAALGRFAQHGFHVRWWHAMNRSPVQHLPALGWLGKYGRKYGWAKMVSRAGTWVANHKIPNRFYTGSVQLFDDTFGRILPVAWSRLLLVVLERPAEAPPRDSAVA